MTRQRLSLTISLLFSAILPIHIYFSSPLPLAGILLGILLFPVASIWNNYRKSVYHQIYILVFSIIFGFTFAYGSPHPVGFNDTFRHLQFALEAGPRLPTGDILSHVFGLTYIIPHVFSLLLNIEILDVVRIVPALFYTVTVLTFHSLLSRGLLEGKRWQLTVTLLFAINWGVFRFMIEYRTLNISLASGILFLGILTNFDRIGKKLSSLGTIAIVVLAISHFATFVFILLIASIYGISQVRTQVALSVFQLLIIGWCTLVAYLLFMNHFGTLGESLSYILREFIFASEPANAANPAESTLNLPYGFRVFVLDWFRRGIVGIACLIITVLTVKTRNRDHIFLVLAGGTIGAILVVTFITGFALLPPRVMTFFAIPAGLIIGVVLETGMTVSSVNVRRIIKTIAVIIVVLSVLTSMAKLPSYIIGETKPIRDEAPVDRDNSLNVSHQDMVQLEFTNKYVSESISDQRSRFISYYYGYGPARYLWAISQLESCNIVYDSGESKLYTGSKLENCTYVLQK